MNINEKLKAVLPKSTMIYLDPKEGLTSSEANHIANMIKEIARNYTSDVERSSAATEAISTDKGERTLKTGYIAPLNSFLKPGQLFGLSAWLRSGIKAKDSGMDLLDKLTVQQLDIEKREPKFTVKQPVSENIQYDESYAKDPDPAELLTIPELAEYYDLEAQAASIGKYIHEKGILDTIRKDVLNFKEISRFTLDGKEQLVERTPVCSAEEISALYFSLQKTYRDIEGKLNWYKSKVKTLASQHNIQVNKDYTDACNKANAEYNAAYLVYSKQYNEYCEQHKLWKNEMETDRIELYKYLAAHKIIVPDHLKPILDEVKTILG